MFAQSLQHIRLIQHDQVRVPSNFQIVVCQVHRYEGGHAGLPLCIHISAFDAGVTGFEIQEIRLVIFIRHACEENRQREGEGVEKGVRRRAQPARRMKREDDGDGMVHVESVRYFAKIANRFLFQRNKNVFVRGEIQNEDAEPDRIKFLVEIGEGKIVDRDVRKIHAAIQHDGREDKREIKQIIVEKNFQRAMIRMKQEREESADRHAGDVERLPEGVDLVFVDEKIRAV